MRLLYAIIIGMAVLAGGCASTKAPIGVDPTASKPVQTAQAAITEGFLLIAAAGDQIAQQKADGIITAAERDVKVGELRMHFATLKDAQKLLADGKEALATNRAAIVRTLVTAMQRELAKKARTQ